MKRDEILYLLFYDSTNAMVQGWFSKYNLSDMFTKEDKHISHFIGIRDAVVKSSASAYRIKIHDKPNILYTLP